MNYQRRRRGGGANVDGYNRYNSPYRNYDGNGNNFRRRNYNNNFYRGNNNNNSYRRNYNNNFNRGGNNNNFPRRNYNQSHRSDDFDRNQDDAENSDTENTGKSSRQTRFVGRRRTNRSKSRQARGNGPRQLQLNDFMPPELRDMSPVDVPNLPADFNLTNSGATTTSTRPRTPNNALPQRSKFVTQTVTSNNRTQPFNVTDDNTNDNRNQQARQPSRNQQQRQQQLPNTTTTTASFVRRKRRNRQKQYRNMTNQYDENYNRFDALRETDVSTDIESNYGDEATDASPFRNNINNNNKQNKTKKKQRIYLQPNRIMRYMQDNSSTTVTGRGNQAYVLAASSIYDEWIRNNYELQVWQQYLKIGMQHKHWVKEVVQRTKKRDDETNRRFIQKKINQLTVNIARASATISDLQIQLCTYWTQTVAGPIAATMTPAASAGRIREVADRVERSILNYIQHCTQHVRKMAEQKIQIARAQMEEYKALQDFQEAATPNQWNIHLMLKQKMKTWNTKNKHYLTAAKRVDYDLPPKFISNINLTFRIDESIMSKEEAQILYDQMRQLTKEYRSQAMSLHLQATTREREILTAEIEQIIEGLSHEDDNQESHTGVSAFKHYDELRKARMNLEAEQSLYFLEEQRVEGEIKEQEEIVAPTLTRSLGEDFLLRP